MMCLLVIYNLLQLNPLVVTVTGIEEPRGTIRMAVYDNAANHLNEQRLTYYKEVPVTSTGSMQIELQLPDGAYSLAIYHDVNDDKKLNTNLVGIPKEPYGFSMNAMGTFGPPSFTAARLIVPQTSSTVINLR